MGDLPATHPETAMTFRVLLIDDEADRAWLIAVTAPLSA